MPSDLRIRFPAFVVDSADDFRRLRQAQSSLFDERYRREQALGSREDAMVLGGTCGVCLRVVRYVSRFAGGSPTADGRVVPNWREEQACDCPYALVSRQRALLHLALSRAGAPGWYRVALLGADAAIERFLRDQFGDLACWPSVDHARGVLPAEDGSMHLVVSADHLHRVPPLDAMLAEVARVLSPGGVFVFTVPFDVSQEVTRSEVAQGIANGPTLTAQAVHAFGWDVMDRVRRAGFADCCAHCYWSEELGYLGTFNFVFEAFR